MEGDNTDELLEEAAEGTAGAFKSHKIKKNSVVATENYQFTLVSQNGWLLPLMRRELLSEF